MRGPNGCSALRAATGLFSLILHATFFPILRTMYRASQFSRYLLERNGIPDRDKNARLNTDKLIKYSRFRAFLAPF
jgi:hypothetical protein